MYFKGNLFRYDFLIKTWFKFGLNQSVFVFSSKKFSSLIYQNAQLLQ